MDHSKLHLLVAAGEQHKGLPLLGLPIQEEGTEVMAAPSGMDPQRLGEESTPLVEAAHHQHHLSEEVATWLMAILEEIRLEVHVLSEVAKVARKQDMGARLPPTVLSMLVLLDNLQWAVGLAHLVDPQAAKVWATVLAKGTALVASQEGLLAGHRRRLIPSLAMVLVTKAVVDSLANSLVSMDLLVASTAGDNPHCRKPVVLAAGSV